MAKFNIPENWDETAQLNWASVKEGVYLCTIRNAEIGSSKKGDQMLTLTLDIAEQGEFYKFFSKHLISGEYRKDSKLYQLLISKSYTYLKKLIDNIESYNKNFKWDGEDIALVNKYVAVEFVKETYDWNDEKRVSVRPRNSVGIEKYANIKELSVADVFAVLESEKNTQQEKQRESETTDEEDLF